MSAVAPMTAPDPARASRARRCALVAGAVAALAALAHAPAVGCGFIDFDDVRYVSENRRVLDGLTAEGAGWAWTTLDRGNWHPLTWLSLQLDAGVWGPGPFGFHLTNVALHAVTAGLLFVVLAALTGAEGRSAAAAALFAVHPLRVESVAWVSERKDVLCGLFWVLTMGAYGWYAAAPSGRRMAAVAAAFALGLTAKPMLVTLPFALVLLDRWPLGRLGSRADLIARVREKWPLFVLAAASAAVTVYAQARGGAVRDLATYGVTERVSGAGVAYVAYLRKTLLPTDLAIFYPYPPAPRPWWHLAGAVCLLAAITAAAVRLRQRAPYLLVGWLWYLGTLVPVIGLIQVGNQAYADRYTYVPHIGLVTAAVWGVADLLSRAAVVPRWRFGLAAAAVAGCALTTRAQIAHWADPRALWGHAIAVTDDNYFAHWRYGWAFAAAGDYERAADQYERAAGVGRGPYAGEIARDRATALGRLGRWAEAERAARLALELVGDRTEDAARCWFLLGTVSHRRGNLPEAADRMGRAFERAPDYPGLRNDYAVVLTELGRPDEAIRMLTAAAAANPADADVAGNLGALLLERNRFAEAVPHLRRAVEAEPRNAAHRGRLAAALAGLGDRPAAVGEARAAARLDPEWPRAAADRAWALATDPDPAGRDGAAAVRLAELACASAEAPPPPLLEALAAALAEAGRYAEAVAAAERAAAAADRLGQRQQAADARKRADVYRSGRPIRGP
jgi:Flp pilus assembly protein TadD